MRAIRPLIIAMMLVPTGCLDSSRIDSTCTWAERSAERLDPSSSEGRAHLRADAQLAGEIGQRFADVRYRNRADLNDPIQRECTAAMLESVARRHGVALDVVQAAQYDRIWWADVLAVYLPLGVVVAVAMHRITRRVVRSFEPEDRGIMLASIACFVVATAAIGLGVGQFWAFNVETMFLRNPHLGFRGTFVPILRHGWIAVLSLLALSTVVAVWSYRGAIALEVRPGERGRRAVPSAARAPGSRRVV